MNILDKLETKLERVTRYENYLSALCPFHDDTNPSFLVYKDYYTCKSCGANGHPQELLSELDHTFRPQPKKRSYHNPFTKWSYQMDLEMLCRRSNDLLRKLPHMGKYLHDRGIDHSLIMKTGIGYRDGWFIIPVFDPDGDFIGAVARADSNDVDVRYYVPTGQPMLLYCPNWKRLEASRSIIIVYGILDAVSLEKVGLACLTGTLGKKLDPILLKDIRKNIYIIPDNGEEKEAHVLASQLGWRGHVINIKYPHDTKDVNDLLNKHPEKLEEIINGLEFRKRDSSRISDKREIIN